MMINNKGIAKKSQNKISWNKVDGAKGYDVYFAKCGKHLKKTSSTKKTYYVKKKLKNNTCYKYKVKAYTVKNGKKKYIDATPIIKVAGVKTKYSNALSVKINKKYLNLKKGKSAVIKGTITKKSNKKPVAWKKNVKGKIQYISTDKKVVTVNSKGKVTAKGEGFAYIYAFAANGACTAIEVMVE